MITGLFALLTAPLTLSAQVETRPLQVRTLALDSKPISGFYIATSSGYQELSFSIHQPSAIYSAQTAETLPLYKQQTNETGEIEYILFKQLPLPQAGRRILLIGLKSNDAAKFVAIQDNFGEGDSQDWLLVNVSSKALAFQVGNLTPIPIQPRQSMPLRINSLRAQGATVKVAARFDEGWEKFYSTFWPIYENQRCLVLFVPDGESIHVRNFFETVK
jgi:hypothetical protein